MLPSLTLESFVAPAAWTASTGIIAREQLLQKAFVSANFCANLNGVIASSRIGMDSSEAEVYQIALGDVTAAIKLMPIISDASVAKNKMEIEYASYFGQLAQTGVCPNFLLVLAQGRCDRVIFQNSEFNEKVIAYACIQDLKGKYPALAPLITEYAKSRTVGSIIETLQLQYSCNRNSGSANFLVSELAEMDLLEWSKQLHSITVWQNVIAQVLLAIDCIHKHGASHNDLHFGNVLFNNTTGPHPLAMVHDFGKSSALSVDNQKSDYLMFLNEFNNAGMAIPNEIISYTNDLFSKYFA